MTTAYHTPIPYNTIADDDTFNDPMSQIDTAIGDHWTFTTAHQAELVASRGSYVSLDARLDNIENISIVAGGNVVTTASGAAVAAQQTVTVVSTAGFVAGASVEYLLGGTTLEYNTIDAVTDATHLLLDNNIGAGGILDGGLVALISTGIPMAANVIPHGATDLTLVDTIEYVNGGLVNVKAKGASPSTAASINSAALQAAIDAADAINGTTVIIPPGRYEFDTKLSIVGMGIQLQGQSHSSQEVGGSTLVYTGTTSPAIEVSGPSASIAISNLNIQYTSGSFVGTLVDVYAGGFMMDSCGLTGVGTSTALYLLSLDGCTDVSITRCVFNKAQYGILGQAVAGDGWANSVSISGCTFNTGITAGDIRNPGNGWSIRGVDFEALASGKGAAIVVDVGVAPSGCSISGCWFGDATEDELSWSWIYWRGTGLSITGNHIHGVNPRNGNSAVKIMAASSGINIAGNQMDYFTVAIILDVFASEVYISGNDFTNCETNVFGTPAGNAIIQSMTSTSLCEFWSGGVLRTQMLADGKVGIAKTPAVPLDVLGITRLDGYVLINNGATTKIMLANDGGAVYFDGCNVGISDTTPDEKLDVNGNINVTGTVKVADVQVIGPRVVDARCDDVANSGDATTDGLIDALRDAMIAHGLIAAA